LGVNNDGDQNDAIKIEDQKVADSQEKTTKTESKDQSENPTRLILYIFGGLTVALISVYIITVLVRRR
jgi:hypothetical protein